MVERRTNISQFAGVNALQKDIERLTKERDALAKERENAQTRLLEEHGVALAEMKTTLDLLVERTKDLPDISKRVTRLESWKAFIGGIAAAFTMIGGAVGFIVGTLARSK
jgi:phosphoenolpyruvate-protein kinase (PTS system EI component)